MEIMESSHRKPQKRVTSMINSINRRVRRERFDNQVNCTSTKDTNLKELTVEMIYNSCKIRGKYWLKNSRFSGIPFAIIYGALVYLYLMYMMFPGEKNVVLTNQKLRNLPNFCNKKNTHNLTDETYPTNTPAQTYATYIINSTYARNVSTQTNATSNETKSTVGKSNTVGLVISLSITLALILISIYSKRARCIMVLVLPGIIAGRGRAVLMTAVVGLLVEGPINSINYNINQIVESSACMYHSMKNLACKFTTQIEKTMAYMAHTIKEIQNDMFKDLKEVKDKIEDQTQKAQKELQQKKERLEKKLKKISDDMSFMKNTLDGINSPCKFGENIWGGIKKFGNSFIRLFSQKKRRRRAVKVCGIKVPFPETNFSPDLNLESLKELNDWLKDIVPDVNFPSFCLPDLKKLVNVPSIRNIREKILSTVSDVFSVFKEYLQSLKKSFLSISIILLMVVSYQYLREYYSDDSFDNRFIDNNIRVLWQQCNFNKLTPLRHWELNARYQVSASPKLSKNELKRVFVKALPTILVIISSLFIMMGDYALAELLSTLAVNGKYAISFEGMEQGVSFANALQATQDKQNSTEKLNLKPLKLEKIDLSTDPCLPRPLHTNSQQIISIIVLILLMALSCFFDAYVSRIRPKICNMFYEERAKERGLHLYEKLESGRNIRRIQLRKIVSRELKRRKKLQEFSWFTKNFTLLLSFFCFQNVKIEKQFNCPACAWNIKCEESELMRIEEQNDTRICKDCALDL